MRNSLLAVSSYYLLSEEGDITDKKSIRIYDYADTIYIEYNNLIIIHALTFIYNEL